MKWNQILKGKKLRGRKLLDIEEKEIKYHFVQALLPDLIIYIEKEFAVIGQFFVLSELKINLKLVCKWSG